MQNVFMIAFIGPSVFGTIGVVAICGRVLSA